MLTMQSLIDKEYPANMPLNEKAKKDLLAENSEANYSYRCLLREYLMQDPTPKDLLRGYSGVQLFKIEA